MIGERTPIFSFKTKDVALELSIFCGLVVCYSVIALQHELAKAQEFSIDVANKVIGNISSFIPVAFVAVLTCEIGWYLIMLLWNLHKREIEAKAKAEGIAEGLDRGRAQGMAKGRAEGIAEGLDKGRAETNKSWGEWNARRLQAEKTNTEFNEPPPA